MTPYPPERHLLRDLRLSFDDSGDGSPRVAAGRAGTVRRRRCAACRRAGDARRRDRRRTRREHRPTELDRDRGPHAPPHGRRDRRRGRSARADPRAPAARRSCSRSRCTRPSASIGVATMSFSVLPRRAENPDIAATRPTGPSTMALEASGLDAPLFDLVGIETVDAARGIVELPGPGVGHELDGGAAGRCGRRGRRGRGARSRCGTRPAAPLVVTDLQLTYLSFGQASDRCAPRRRFSRCTPDHGVARVALFDTGAESRQMSVGRVVATRSLT